MYISTFLALLPFALSSPITHKSAVKRDFFVGFEMIAARSASPIHLQSIVASDYGFYIGVPSATYCPSPPVTDCQDYTNYTVIACQQKTGKPTACGMNTAVPGGQEIYVNSKTGALGYTIPHSGAVPEGALLSGFEYTAQRSAGDNIGALGFCGAGAVGQSFVACPTTKSTQGPYQVFVAVKGKDLTDCLGFDILTSGTNETAWEYT